MPQWMNDTKNSISRLKKEGYFDNWTIKKAPHIIFHIFPGLDVSNEWFQKRMDIYDKNAKTFEINKVPEVNFFVYPSINSVENLKIVPVVSFLKEREIHGHLKQSPGHELTHILLGSVNPSENLPPNGLWEEALCVYYDGTNTDRKKHSQTLNYSEEIINTSWDLWKENLPSNLYPLAGSIAQYCIEKYGIKLTLDFIRGFKEKGNNYKDLLLTVLGSPYEKIRAEWINWLLDKGIHAI